MPQNGEKGQDHQFNGDDGPADRPARQPTGRPPSAWSIVDVDLSLLPHAAGPTDGPFDPFHRPHPAANRRAVRVSDGALPALVAGRRHWAWLGEAICRCDGILMRDSWSICGLRTREQRLVSA
jgi:hypothetical protein